MHPLWLKTLETLELTRKLIPGILKLCCEDTVYEPSSTTANTFEATATMYEATSTVYKATATEAVAADLAAKGYQHSKMLLQRWQCGFNLEYADCMYLLA